MLLPETERSRAVKLALKWLKDPATEILYMDYTNGAVLRNGDATLSITMQTVCFTVKGEPL
jgi:hypothetical protein